VQSAHETALPPEITPMPNSSDAGSKRSLAPADADRVARDALGSAALSSHLTPALPDSWPPSTHVVRYLAYPSEPLPTGRVAYEIGAATHVIEVHLDNGVATPHGLPSGPALGIQTRHGADPSADAMAAAERALFDVVVGKTTPDVARPGLEPYVAWFGANAVIAQDVGARMPAFVTWLGVSR
jgi:hypothetical protein